jgi:hypothetical protein
MARTEVRPFRINVPEEELVDLRRRIAETRWPDKETVSDRSQGVQLAKLQPLAEYWGTDDDWRKVEATLNELPQFITNIDGQEHLHPGCRQRLSWRAMSSPAELDRAGVSQAHLLQQARQGRPLRGAGTAAALL